MPIPCGLNDGFQIVVLGLPAQFCRDPLGTGNQYCWIPRPSVSFYPFDGPAHHFFHHVDNFPDAETGSVAQIVHIGSCPCRQGIQGQDVGRCQISYVDVVRMQVPSGVS